MVPLGNAVKSEEIDGGAPEELVVVEVVVRLAVDMDERPHAGAVGAGVGVGARVVVVAAAVAPGPGGRLGWVAHDAGGRLALLPVGVAGPLDVALVGQDDVRAHTVGAGVARARDVIVAVLALSLAQPGDARVVQRAGQASPSSQGPELSMVHPSVSFCGRQR